MEQGFQLDRDDGWPGDRGTPRPRASRGDAPLNRLVLAQDTGGAIRGAVRADYFWGLGSRAFTEMHIETFERVPLAAAVTVTNLPVDGDLGLQLDLRAGYRVFDWLAVNALAGWNARTINHYGFTGGGGLTLNW